MESKWQCQECDYSTDDECFAEDHSNDTGHQIIEIEVKSVLE